MKVSIHAGRLKNFKPQWSEITKEPRILNWLDGYKIPFLSSPFQGRVPKSPPLSNTEAEHMENSVCELLKMGAIEKCQHSPGEFLSPIFLVPKPNGKFRFILNLKHLNEFILAPHFKMEDTRSVIQLIRPNCFFASLDLQDAYYMLPVHRDHRQYLRFEWKTTLYEFTCLVFGLNVAPYVFTKLMKPVVSHLRDLGFLLVIYIDDLLFMANSYEECANAIKVACQVLQRLGFLVNYQKSSIIPDTSIEYLGLVFDSVRFAISISEVKQNKILKMLNAFAVDRSYSIRSVAQLIGTLISIRYAVPYGLLYTRALERTKILALEGSNNYDAQVKLSDSIRVDIEWWIRHVPNCSSYIKVDKFERTIFTDASLTGWGASYNNVSTSGWWLPDESKNNINYLELLAVFYALKCFASSLSHSQILLRIDNTTAISYINKMGGVRYPHLGNLAKVIWTWCETRNIWLFATYIPSKENTVADRESRTLECHTEWQLNHLCFEKIVLAFGHPNIDLFASRHNTHCKVFMSWRPDPDAISIDAFTEDWSKWFFYAFPPFSLILRVIRKIITDNARGILVVPNWPSQSWFPLFKTLWTSSPIFFDPAPNLLLSPFRNQKHPLHRSLSLVAVSLSGKP